jgi:flagellar M-ring protein FliF
MDFLNQIRAWVKGMTPKQQMLLVGGAAATLAILWAFTALLSTPDYKTLYTGSNAADLQSLAARLDAKRIPNRLTPDGTGIQVPADELDKARLEIASGGGLPASGRLGFEIFDKPDWMGSDFAEKVNYQRAMEGELERTIETLGEVQAARVHIVMPRESLFTDREQQAKASIVLTLKRMPSGETELAIRQLVAGAVENLQPENVTLIDSTGRMLSAGNHQGNSATAGELERTLTEKLLATLEPVAGHDHVRASVNVEYDLATTEDNRETYDPNSVVAVSTQKTEEVTSELQSGGVPGTTSNVPSKGQAPAKPNSILGPSQSNRTESSTYAVNRTQHHILQPAGAIKRISAAILLDASAGSLSADQLRQVTQLARAALDIDASRGDTIEVQSIPFAQTPVETPEAPSLPTQVVNVVQRWISLVRYAGIGLLFLVVYMLVLRPLRRQMATTLRQVSANLAAQAQQRAAPALAGKSALSQSVQAELDAQAQALGDPELRRQVIDKIKKDTPTAGRLIQSWVRQSAEKK